MDAEGFVYSFDFKPKSTDMASFGKIEMTSDVNISDQYTIINNQIYFSEVPQIIVFNTSIQKSIITETKLMYQDANSSWKEASINFDTEVANARFNFQTEGEKMYAG